MQVANLAAGLVGRGVSVCILSLIDNIGDHAVLDTASIHTSSLNMRKGRARLMDLVRYVRAVRLLRPTIVHSHMVHANILARIGRPFVDAPLVCTAHNVRESPIAASRWNVAGTMGREFAYRMSDPLCNLTTQVSNAGAKHYVAVKAVPSRKMRVVPNGVDIARFRPDQLLREGTRKSLGIGRSFVWVAVGRLELAKDYPVMIKAFDLATRGKDCRLLIAGRGTLETELRQLTAQLGLTEKVRFLGLRTDIAEVLNAADAYVMSSMIEGFPVSLLEAGAVGLPIVVTDAGGAAETVVAGRTGWVVPPHNPESLAKHMRDMMELPVSERTTMGSEGRAYVVAEFSMNAVLDRWMAIYQEVLQ